MKKRALVHTNILLPKYQFEAQQHGFQSSNLCPEFSDQLHVCILQHKNSVTTDCYQAPNHCNMLHAISLEELITPSQ